MAQITLADRVYVDIIKLLGIGVMIWADAKSYLNVYLDFYTYYSIIAEALFNIGTPVSTGST